MANNKDYYEILGVPKSAPADQIKQAYRRLAREHHPDMVKDGDKTAAELRFKEINEAYQVLSDTQKRQMYDQFGHAGVGAGAGAGGFGRGYNGMGGGGPFTYTYNTSGGQGFDFGDFDPFDVFEEFFGFRGFGGRSTQRKGKNLYYEMEIDFADAVHGAQKTVQVESGPVTIKIPVGIRSGTEMRFTGKGLAGPSGLPPGDLFITFKVKIPKEFQRLGDNLAVLVEVDFVQAALGGDVDVPVVDTGKPSGCGTAKLKIPSGTQSAAQFRLRGKGLPLLHGKGQGDVIVQVIVSIPKKLTKKQRELLEQFRALR